MRDVLESIQSIDSVTFRVLYGFNIGLRNHVDREKDLYIEIENYFYVFNRSFFAAINQAEKQQFVFVGAGNYNMVYYFEKEGVSLVLRISFPVPNELKEKYPVKADYPERVKRIFDEEGAFKDLTKVLNISFLVNNESVDVKAHIVPFISYRKNLITMPQLERAMIDYFLRTGRVMLDPSPDNIVVFDGKFYFLDPAFSVRLYPVFLLDNEFVEKKMEESLESNDFFSVAKEMYESYWLKVEEKHPQYKKLIQIVKAQLLIQRLRLPAEEMLTIANELINNVSLLSRLDDGFDFFNHCSRFDSEFSSYKDTVFSFFGLICSDALNTICYHINFPAIMSLNKYFQQEILKCDRFVHASENKQKIIRLSKIFQQEVYYSFMHDTIIACNKEQVKIDFLLDFTKLFLKMRHQKILEQNWHNMLDYVKESSVFPSRNEIYEFEKAPDKFLSKEFSCEELLNRLIEWHRQMEVKQPQKNVFDMGLFGMGKRASGDGATSSSLGAGDQSDHSSDDDQLVPLYPTGVMPGFS